MEQRVENQFFIAGTDTGVGKTMISCALLRKAKKKGFLTQALKPIASGCEQKDHTLYNEDAVLLQKEITEEMMYSDINPMALHTAIAPHIAAHQEKKNIDLQKIIQHCQSILSKKQVFIVVEGAGGWCVPLSYDATVGMNDIPIKLKLPVVLVIGLRLGCLNHALLTVRAIQQDRVPFLGWVANQIDPHMSCVRENITTLKNCLPGQFLGTIPYMPSVELDTIADLLHWPQLNNPL